MQFLLNHKVAGSMAEAKTTAAKIRRTRSLKKYKATNKSTIIIALTIVPDSILIV